MIIFIISFNQTFSQTYHKLIRENTYWDEIWYDNSFPCNINSIERTFFEGDTLIFGKTYKKMSGYYFYTLSTIGFCPPFAIDTVRHEIYSYMREDTVNSRVYIIDASSSVEHLLFDFSLELGDTFNSTYGSSIELRVVSIDSIQQYDGEYRKRIGMLEVNHNYDWDTVYIRKYW